MTRAQPAPADMTRDLTLSNEVKAERVSTPVLLAIKLSLGDETMAVGMSELQHWEFGHEMPLYRVALRVPHMPRSHGCCSWCCSTLTHVAWCHCRAPAGQPPEAGCIALGPSRPTRPSCFGPDDFAGPGSGTPQTRPPVVLRIMAVGVQILWGGETERPLRMSGHRNWHHSVRPVRALRAHQEPRAKHIPEERNTFGEHVLDGVLLDVVPAQAGTARRVTRPGKQGEEIGLARLPEGKRGRGCRHDSGAYLSSQKAEASKCQAGSEGEGGRHPRVSIENTFGRFEGLSVFGS